MLLVSATAALACEKREEQMRPGETHTTSGTLEEGAKTADQKMGEKTGEKASESDRMLSEERAKTAAAKAEADKERARADACEHAQQTRLEKSKAAKEKAAKAAKAKGAEEAKRAEAEKARQAQEAQAKPAAPPTVREEEFVGEATITAAPVTPAPAPEVNTSTTLGDGTSGMYTGGQGTYGGKATWGTGAGSTAQPPQQPAPQPAPEK